ncbi:ABC transporter substrate-binding protein [uncultured Tolumonas sp.]|uniref:ABC transporter substrate-binding protein n=1 Tax=uncultured Tolumonas sp. TaxID=263765 RepID=UPI00292E7761|nr:ABC transporter substrate-binding protein [uncultured Tolumonas sp.]
MHTITDLAGHKISVPNQPNHIACLEVLCYQKLFMLGESPRISQMVMTNAPWMEITNPAVKKIPKVIGEANIEELLARKTELIFYRYNAEQVAAMYARAGIPALYSQPLTKQSETAEEFLEGQRQAIRLFANALNTQQAHEKAEAWIKYHDDKVAFVKSSLSNLPTKEKLRVYYLRGPDALSTQGRGSNTFWYGELAGADMVTKRQGAMMGKGAITMEDMIRLDPQVIFVGRQYPVSLVTTDPRWQQISAVKHHRVYAMPDGVFFWDGGLEGVLLMEYEAKTLYPKLFNDLDLKTEFRDFYQRFYHYALSDAESEKLLSGVSPAGTRINLMNN